MLCESAQNLFSLLLASAKLNGILLVLFFLLYRFYRRFINDRIGRGIPSREDLRRWTRMPRKEWQKLPWGDKIYIMNEIQERSSLIRVRPSYILFFLTMGYLGGFVMLWPQGVNISGLISRGSIIILAVLLIGGAFFLKKMIERRYLTVWIYLVALGAFAVWAVNYNGCIRRQAILSLPSFVMALWFAGIGYRWRRLYEKSHGQNPS